MLATNREENPFAAPRPVEESRPVESRLERSEFDAAEHRAVMRAVAMSLLAVVDVSYAFVCVVLAAMAVLQAAGPAQFGLGVPLAAVAVVGIFASAGVAAWTLQAAVRSERPPSWTRILAIHFALWSAPAVLGVLAGAIALVGL